MTSRYKFFSLVLIWIAFIIACMVTFLGRPIGLGEGILGFFYIACATGVSIAIMESKVVEEHPRYLKDTAEAHDGKRKREEISALERLVDSMSEEERAALIRRLSTPETVILGDDGELQTVRRSGRA